MIDKAILKINSKAEFTINDNNIDKITWLNGTTPISKADIEAKMVELQAEWDANEAAHAAKQAKEVKIAPKPYVAKRKLAYPQIGDQLDMLWHSIDKNPDLKTKFYDFYEACKAVKVKYGKDD